MTITSYQPLGEQAWLTQLQKGSGGGASYVRRRQRGQGLGGSVLGNALGTIIPLHHNVRNASGRNNDDNTIVKRKRRKKTSVRKNRVQKGKGLGIRPRKQMQKASGPLKSIKRIASTKKKQLGSRKKRKNTSFGLFKK